MMAGYLTKGDGRTVVTLQANNIGDDLVVLIYNQNAHLGAIAVGEYDHEHQRASVSVITRLGHKEDAIAQRAAYLISRATKKPVCVIAGIHLENIARREIDEISRNAIGAVEELISSGEEGSVLT